MKKVLLALLTLVILMDVYSISADSNEFTALKKQLQNAAKPVLMPQKATEKGSILLRNPDPQAKKNLEALLNGKFLKFIGSDDQSRADSAQELVDDFKNLLQGVGAAFLKLALWELREKFAAEKVGSGYGQQATVTAMKQAQLNAAKLIKVVNPKNIKWGAAEQAGARVISVDQIVESSFSRLGEIQSRISSRKALVQKGQARCKLSPCKERFELLAAANDLLDALVNKIKSALNVLGQYAA